MNKKIIALVISALIIAIVFAGTIIYYNDQITNLKNQNNNQINNLQKANLVTSLGIHEILNNSTYNADDPTTYNHLDVGGTVTNFGLGTAYNAGLLVVALDITGNVVINMTVPFVAGTYGLGGNRGPTTLGSLGSEEVGTVDVAIYHPGIAATWTVTPIWTATP